MSLLTPSFGDRMWLVPTFFFLAFWSTCSLSVSPSPPDLISPLLAAFGFVTMMSRLYQFWGFLTRNRFLPDCSNLRSLRRSLNWWRFRTRCGMGVDEQRVLSEQLQGVYGGSQTTYACITGATSGIGLEFARQLGLAGFNLVLFERTRDTLEKAKEELLECFKAAEVTNQKDVAPVDIKLVAHGDLNDVVSSADSSKMTSTDSYHRILKDNQVLDLDIAIFVNVAGMLDLGKLADQHVDKVRALFEVNCAPALYFTKWMCEQMRLRGGRSAGESARSGIINVSSRAAYLVSPGGALYSATKAFVDQLTQSVAFEMRNEKVDVLSLRPGLVSTKMTNYASVSSSLVNACVRAEETVKAALFGLLAGESVLSGPWQHETDMLYCSYLQSWFPETVKARRYHHYCGPKSVFGGSVGGSLGNQAVGEKHDSDSVKDDTAARKTKLLSRVG